MKVYGVSELLAEIAAENRRCRLRLDERWLVDSRWEGWRLDPEILTLGMFTTDGGFLYEIDLEQCLTAAQLLDRIMQIRGKDWQELNMNAVLGGLLLAIDDVLHPQATLCSWGRSKRLDRRQLRDLVDRIATAWPGDPDDDVAPTVHAKRETTFDGIRTWVIDCPYCGCEHTHGANPGHRVAHCHGDHRRRNPGYIRGYVLAEPRSS